MNKHINEMLMHELENKLKQVETARVEAKRSGQEVLWHQLYELGHILTDECARRAKEAGCADVAQKQFGIIL